MTSESPSSRGFFGFGCDALAGIVSALVIGFALAHPASPMVLLAYVAPVPLFIAGLGAGPKSALLAALAGAAALFAASSPGVTLFYFFTYALPAAGLVALALRRRMPPAGTGQFLSTGNLFTAAAIYPCVIFLMIYSQTLDQAGGLLGMTVDALETVIGQVSAKLTESGETVTPEMTMKLHQYIQFLARITPALAMCAWLFATLIMMGAAQSLLQQKGWALRPTFDLSRLNVPRWFVPLALIAAAASFAPQPYGYVALNIAIVFGIPFFFVGLAVIHDTAAHTRAPTFTLVCFYVVMSVVVHLALLVTLLGVIDQWADFRKRLADRALNLAVKQQGERT